MAIQGAKNVVQAVEAPHRHRVPTAGVIYRDPDTVHMLSNVGGTSYIRAWSN
ncbi:hypothetical protein JOD64_000761 [Micromonospora luteifusca]|uniref:Uncharacterized protein n=1 Tax=Micromonospora luteifusca TaxID=709860 RepID=A0ABS2LMX2_9ACTN|nr:hypothetical protein [Micromonospora luteifusca]